MRKGLLSDKSVIAHCPVYQPVPMRFVSSVLKNQNNQMNSTYKGIKTVKRSIPARPVNINALVVALANISEKPIKKVRAAILSELPAGAYTEVPEQSAEENAQQQQAIQNTRTPRRAGRHRLDIGQVTPIARRTRSGSISRGSEPSGSEPSESEPSQSSGMGRIAGNYLYNEQVQSHVQNFENTVRVANSYFPD